MYSIFVNDVVLIVQDFLIIYLYGIVGEFFDFGKGFQVFFGGIDNFDFNYVMFVQCIKIYIEQIVGFEIMDGICNEIERVE